MISLLPCQVVFLPFLTFVLFSSPLAILLILQALSAKPPRPNTLPAAPSRKNGDNRCIVDSRQTRRKVGHHEKRPSYLRYGRRRAEAENTRQALHIRRHIFGLAHFNAKRFGNIR